MKDFLFDLVAAIMMEVDHHERHELAYGLVRHVYHIDLT